MKKITVFLLLVTSSIFAQNHHFKAERNQVYWEATFKTAEKEILTLIDKNHTKVTVNKEDNSGLGASLNCDCTGGSWYFEQSFDLKFTVEIEGDKYKVTAYDITFDGEGETNANNRLENYVLQIGRNTFIKSKKNEINLACFEAYFLKLFKIPNSEIIAAN